ncbi:LytR/AlgR family response regulator transcription factor [Chitinophaga alhagiae]|uniref:LytR/AlgR family response regulator transcription factor n=1 Tax=Chitinophaga alhagiae TaxID=2203219 RepID=UPI000E5BDE01|nr:LytTR family DNA-binding domain-containing protein [Chitinophaga alhagiae]
MKKIACIIIDDEPIARRILEDYISADGRLWLQGSYKKAADAVAAIAEHNIELIFLDINMPGLNGFQFLKTMSRPPAVVFTTAYREFALQGFDADAVDYLLKPITQERFFLAIDKAFRLLRAAVPDASANDCCFVRSDGMLLKVLYRDILFIEALKEYVKIVTREKPVITYHTLSGLEEKMPPGMFYRIHRSYLVNIHAVDGIDGALVRIGKHELPLSREERDTFTQFITQGKIISKNKPG